MLVRLAMPSDLAGVLQLYRELRPLDHELSETEAQAAFSQILNDPNLHTVVCEHEAALASNCMLAIVPNLASNAAIRPGDLPIMSMHDMSGLPMLSAVAAFALCAPAEPVKLEKANDAAH